MTRDSNVLLRPIVAPPRNEAIVTFNVSSFSRRLAAASLEKRYTAPRAAAEKSNLHVSLSISCCYDANASSSSFSSSIRSGGFPQLDPRKTY